MKFDRHAVSAALSTLVFLFAAAANAQNLTIYDDALQNGWQNYSYGAGSDFANTNPVYAGTKSISFVPDGSAPNAVSMARTAQPVTTAQYPVLHSRPQLRRCVAKSPAYSPDCLPIPLDGFAEYRGMPLCWRSQVAGPPAQRCG